MHGSDEQTARGIEKLNNYKYGSKASFHTQTSDMRDLLCRKS